VFGEESDAQKYKNIKLICDRLNEYDLLKQRESILDIGAGMGWSLWYLKSHYPSFKRFSAIEASEHCMKNLKQKIGAEIVSNDVESNWHRGYCEKFDFIIMRHVLEHLLDPVEALRNIKATLAKDGIIYIAVPDMMHPKGSLKNYWYRAVHTFYFSEQTLSRVACLANLVPIVIKSGEDSELWGIFRISSNDAPHGGFDNAYHRQLAVIRRQKRKTIYLNFKYNIAKLILFFVPSKVKSKLKHI
jgi:SAM-dependent methyltransferase